MDTHRAPHCTWRFFNSVLEQVIPPWPSWKGNVLALVTGKSRHELQAQLDQGAHVTRAVSLPAPVDSVSSSGFIIRYAFPSWQQEALISSSRTHSLTSCRKQEAGEMDIDLYVSLEFRQSWKVMMLVFCNKVNNAQCSDFIILPIETEWWLFKKRFLLLIYFSEHTVSLFKDHIWP